MNKLWVKRALPFGVYILFILLHDMLKPFVSEEIASIYLTPLLYTVKTVTVFFVLGLFWKSYDELYLPAFNIAGIFTGFAAGALVFVLWIQMDWDFAAIGEPEVFNPYILPDRLIYPFIAIRMFGASVVVPIFEELFWRSFILRYIINPDFTSVKIGTFTWPSFLLSSLLFGLEHNLFLAGIMAGIFYNLLLYRTKNLSYCIFAHGLTNFLLGVYVVSTGNWQFW